MVVFTHILANLQVTDFMMRITFIITLSISIFFSVLQVVRLRNNREKYVRRIVQMIIACAFAVYANIMFAFSHSFKLSNYAHALYYAALDWILFYFMTFILAYCNNYTKAKKVIKNIFMVFCIADAISMTLNLFFGHIVYTCLIKWNDGNSYYFGRFNWGYYPHMVLDYVIILFIIYVLIESISRAVSYYRIRYIVPLAVLLSLLILNGFYMMFELPLDWSVVLYSLAAFIVYYYADRYTPRVLANKTLAESINELGEGLIIFDIDDKCVYTNAMILKYFELTKENCTIESEPIATWLKGKRLRDSFPFEGVVKYRRSIGTLVDLKLYIKPISKRGEYLGCYFQVEDVTKEVHTMNELKEAQHQEAIARAEALRASQAKSEFLANMSHEIRTPINAILGMNEMILREDISPEIQEYARNIQVSGDALLSIINDILDFSKIESGKMELTPVNYDPHKLIEACETLITPRIINKNLEFIIKYDPSIPKCLYGDEVRVRQILINLLTNAAKYTEEGTVTLFAEWNKISDDVGYLCFKVKDTGIGIKPENQKALFEAFQRVDEQKNRNIEGTGLGLSITNKLLSLMNGDISVSSEYGKGSEFIVDIPQKIVDGAPSGEYTKKVNSAKYEYKEAFRAPEAHILAVDDYKMNLTVLKGLLKKTEVKLDLAMSGREAIELASKNPYHLILMDHMMPEMDGIETMKIIKSTPGPNSRTPVIMLTANAIQGVEEQYLSEGFEGYLTKPIDSKALEAELKKYIPDELILG